MMESDNISISEIAKQIEASPFAVKIHQFFSVNSGEQASLEMTDAITRKLTDVLSLVALPATLTHIAQDQEMQILSIALKYEYSIELTEEACRILCASRIEPANHTLAQLNAGNASLCAEFESIHERLIKKS